MLLLRNGTSLLDDFAFETLESSHPGVAVWRGHGGRSGVRMEWCSFGGGVEKGVRACPPVLVRIQLKMKVTLACVIFSEKCCPLPMSVHVRRDQNAAGVSAGSGAGGAVASRLEQQQVAMRGTIEDGGKGLKESGMSEKQFHSSEKAPG